jgi:sugar O-acyltransferase (sialic acid O-acetyltransferase NeuD family)
MSRPLLLVAASGLAREVLEVVRDTGSHTPIGFIDDNPKLWGQHVDGLPVLLGGLERVMDEPQAQVLICAGSGRARADIAVRLAGLGLSADRYATLIHPSAQLGSSTTLGTGSIVLAGGVATTGVAIGRHVVLMPRVVLTHDDVLEDFVTVCAGVSLAGNVHVERGAYLGQGALVRERCLIGEWALVGMGAVVLNDVSAGEVWAGNPARCLRAAAATPNNESLTEVG